MNRTPTAEGFEGFSATWFYLDRRAGTLSENVPAGASFAASKDVKVSISPQFFNGPKNAVGGNAQTKFDGQGKSSAYLKVQLDQITAGTSTKPLTYAALYPLIDSPDDDIGAVEFEDPSSGDPLEEVPLPGASAKFHTPVTAIVGGAKPKSSLLNIISQVIGLAGGPAVKALFPIPAADFTLASNVESLLNSAATAFAPETKQQYWINDRAIDVAANQATVDRAGPDVLSLPVGTTWFAVFQLGANDGIAADIRKIAATQGRKFDIDRGGALITTANAAPVQPNPFDNYIYVTYKAEVTPN